MTSWNYPITRFEDDYRFLSNFYNAAVSMDDGITYPTSEHAYQAYKTEDMNARRSIAVAPGPGAAKRLGQNVDLRYMWDEFKIDVMRDVVLRKFSQHAHLRSALLETYDRLLIEGNTWHDTFWGVDVRTREGENWLGKVLMETRALLQQEDVRV